MTYRILNEFTGSSLFPTRKWVDREDFHSLAEKAYLLCVSLRVLLCIPETKDWADGYLHRTMQSNGFHQWRSNGTDLYVTLWALTQGEYEAGSHDPKHISETGVLRWLRALSRNHSEVNETKRFFLQMDSLLHINESSLKAIRRLAQDWPHIDHYDKKLVVTRLLQIMRARMRRAETLKYLERAARAHDLEIDGACNKEKGENCDNDHAPNLHATPKKVEKHGTGFGFLSALAGIAAGHYIGKALRREGLEETASAGATSSANVAAVATPLGKDSLGAGFDTSLDKGIYQKGKSKKSPIIRR